jgi:hypothetical protein
MFSGTRSYEVNWPRFWQVKKHRLLFCTHEKCNFAIRVQIGNTDKNVTADLNARLNDHHQMHILWDETGLPYSVDGYEQSFNKRVQNSRN